LWYVWLAGPDGEPVVRQFDVPALERAIETSHLPLDAPVREGTGGPIKPLDSHPQLRRALRIRRDKDKALKRRRERRHARQPRAKDPERDFARRVRSRKIRAAVKWGLVAVLAVVAAWAFVFFVLR